MPLVGLIFLLFITLIFFLGSSVKMQEERGFPFSKIYIKPWRTCYYYFQYKNMDLRVFIIASWIFLIFYGWLFYACLEEAKIKEKITSEILVTEPTKLGIKEQYVILNEKESFQNSLIFPEGTKLQRTYYEQCYFGVEFEVDPTDLYILPNGEIYELRELREQKSE